jgi:hypothetical protein
MLIRLSCLVLHPRHKLHHFRNACWSDAWIETARDIVHDIFESSYKSFSGDEPTATDTVHILKFAHMTYN